MSNAAHFTKAAAKMAAELIGTLSREEQQALAESTAKGFRLSVSFIVQPGGSEPGEIQLSAVDDYGAHHAMLTQRINVAKRH